MLTHQFAVKDFMSPKVQTIYSHSNVTHAVKLMADNNIGSLVVVDSSGPIGVFTERELLSRVLGKNRRLEEPIMMEVMSRPFTAIKPDDSLAEAARMMTSKKNRLMVFSDGDLVGIVTATDIVRQIHKVGKAFGIGKVISKKVVIVDPLTSVDEVVHEMDAKRIGSVLVDGNKIPRSIFTERDLLRKVLAPNLRLSTSVGALSTTPLMTAKEGIDGLEAARIMITNKIKRLPLLKGDSLFGIVTARDLVAAFSALS